MSDVSNKINRSGSSYFIQTLTPRWLPQFGMKGRKRQANFGMRFKPPRRRQKDNVRRFKGILGRQEDTTVINTTGKIGIRGTSNRTVVVVVVG